MGAGIERKYYLFALRAFSDITATALLPALLVLLLRKVLHLENTAFYLALAGAFLLTALVFWKKMKTYGEAFKQLADRNGRTGR